MLSKFTFTLTELAANIRRFMQGTTMSSTFTISELAKSFKITTRTIRHYEDKGLLKPKRKAQQRIYSTTDKIHLQLILRGKRIGLSLDEIKHIIDLYKLPKGKQIQKQFLLDKIAERQQQLLEQKQFIDQMLKEINQIVKRFN